MRPKFMGILLRRFIRWLSRIWTLRQNLYVYFVVDSMNIAFSLKLLRCIALRRSCIHANLHLRAGTERHWYAHRRGLIAAR